MSKKKVAVSKSKAQVVKNPVKKVKIKPAEILENPVVDQHVNVENQVADIVPDENPDLLDSVPSVREPKGRKTKEMVVTPEMENAIDEAKKMITEEEMTKAQAAREVWGMLKGHERKQIVHVFMVGCGLTKAGSGTYYQNCKK